jgi:hypothetical protein
VLDLDLLRSELAGACLDAGLEPGSLVVFVVDAVRPARTTPMAYLHPAGFVWPDTVSVFRAVGRERAQLHHLSSQHGRPHRLAVWRGLPGLPAAALGPMLRHELAHARRWEQSGTRFFEADDLLRAAVRAAGGDGYGLLPSELEANAASATYAARTLTATGLAELRSCADCAALLDAPPPPDDVVEATLAELCRRSDWSPWVDGAARDAYVGEVRSACGAWDEQGARVLTAGRPEPQLVVLSPVGPGRSDAGLAR